MDMNSDPVASAGTHGFWSRQFQPSGTPLQCAFDICFGLIAPILCVIYDPAVFRSGGVPSSAFLNTVSLFAYLEIAIGVLALGYYLLVRRASTFLSGVLYGGALFSLLLGLAMLPLTLLGLMLLIGVFGFTPFLSGFVFWRNAHRCWQESNIHTPGNRGLRGFRMAAFGTLIALGLPMGVQAAITHTVDRAVAALQFGSQQDFTRAVRTLSSIFV